ncbi:MAG TPA: transglycosylase SLT domain-containing protein, partial [Oligoflexia bacterium]|nr:transglycosylase SLT domain-containing protein [Oligoflexia bacterium]
QATSSTEGTETFSKVLADLEAKPEKNRDNKLLESQKVNPNISPGHNAPLLSNMNQTEQSQARPQLSRDNAANVPPFTAINAHAFSGTSVNNPADSVKTAPPVPVLPVGESPPAVPRLVSAKRVYGSSSAAYQSTARRFEVGQIKDIVVTAGKFHGVDPTLSLAVAEAESAYRHDAVSSDGHASKGVFQLLDSTGKHMMGLSGVKDAYDPFDPGMNAFLGVGYLRRLMDIFKSSTKIGANMATTPAKSSHELEKLAVAAFNAGEGNVVRAQEKARALGKNPAEFAAVEPHLPSITREYVQRVARIRADLADDDSGIDQA